VATVAALVVGVVFLVAGGSKLASRSWSAQAAGLGTPAWAAPLVPWWELGVGAGLVVGLERRVLALVALATLLVFTTALARVLRRGEHPVCACFGQWSTRPVGPATIVRNGVLIGLAVLAAV
jgi:uncharacterized membrane protein YphA (DoxX/SURF4 family)